MQLDSGDLIDLSKAYKKLSDANLLASGGSLAELAHSKALSREDGEGRLVKAYVGPDGEHLDDSSSEESSWEEGDEEDERGRSTARRDLPSGGDLDERSLRQPKSLLAAAEEERRWPSCCFLSVLRCLLADLFAGKHVSQYKYKSLLTSPNPELKFTDASGGGIRHKSDVAPDSSYEKDIPGSSVNSANNSENELEKDEIRKAQQLGVKLTEISSVPENNRSVRIIYRGDYVKIVATAKEEHKELRKYLVATDLSEESSHAMEWAIGTVLRDGDTLVAICCLTDESLAEGLGTDDAKANHLGHHGLSVESAPLKSSSISLLATSFHHTSSLAGDSGSNISTSGSPAPSGRNQNPAEEERHRIVEEMTAKISRFLRRTKLQVRVIVEVIHCKNPKHLVNEVIDLVKPTLVILGSRGRSAIKG
jgi:nucleotide-binding universal stress UspA family protein